jgi:hypothetical protein
VLIFRVNIQKPFVTVFAAFVRMFEPNVILKTFLRFQHVFAIEWTFMLRLADEKKDELKIIYVNCRFQHLPNMLIEMSR